MCKLWGANELENHSNDKSAGSICGKHGLQRTFAAGNKAFVRQLVLDSLVQELVEVPYFRARLVVDGDLTSNGPAM